MAANIQYSSVPLPMYGHVAVTWKNATIVWGGTMPGEELGATMQGLQVKATVCKHLKGKWTKIQTSGNIPGWQFHEAQVLNDKMFVLVANNDGDANLHSLDLHTWIWTMLTPSGAQPSKTYSAKSWIFGGKIYFFGGGSLEQEFDQLFCYNASTNSWEWPDMRGNIPNRRRGHLMIISDDTVFLYGGVGEKNQFTCHNDLYVLDMASAMWTKVHGNMSTAEGPMSSWSLGKYTFTRISQSSALVYGSFDEYGPHKVVEDCWLLNLHNAKQLMEPSLIWTKMKSLPPRAFHAAVLQPLSKRLWVIGGLNGKSYLPSNLLKIDFRKLLPLKDLALAKVAYNTYDHDPRLAQDQLPERIRNEIDAYRHETGL